MQRRSIRRLALESSQSLRCESSLVNRIFIKRLILLTLVIAWMAVIFVFSAQTSTESSDLSTGVTQVVCGIFVGGFDKMPEEEKMDILMGAEEFIRTMGHGLEFCGLAVLLAVLVSTYERIGRININGYSNWALAVVMSAAYAITDEIHQIFVPGRVFDWYDIGVDTIGAAIGALLATCICWSIVGRWRKNGLS